MSGQLSARELRRWISSLLYERAQLSPCHSRPHLRTQGNAKSHSLESVIRDPYVCEFLSLKSHQAAAESHFEAALLDRVQAFVLELGRGFYFEAKQKRIIIGGELFFVDLVFFTARSNATC